MGELHLEIYVERLQREYGLEVTVGAPQVNYRQVANACARYVFFMLTRVQLTVQRDDYPGS